MSKRKHHAAPAVAAPAVKTERTSLGLRNALFDTLDDLRNGKVTAQKATAVASLTGQIVAVSKLELGYHRFVLGQVPGEEKAAIPSLSLGQ